MSTPSLNEIALGRGATVAVIAHVKKVVGAGLPTDVRKVAKQCVLDWFACAIAGHSEPLSRILLNQIHDEGGRPVASVVGHADRVTARQAALLNGSYGHAMDYDDVSVAMSGHPTAAILPAILAAAEAEHSSGEKLLTSFVAGYEAAAIIGLLVSPGHYARGFHATGTVGALGAAVGCSTLMGLDEESTARALGIAASQAAGLKAQFGTMCKALHAGKANENGLVAAQLARRGLTSRRDILECEQGFASTQSSDFQTTSAFTSAEDGFFILRNLFKYSASCYGTHGAIEACRMLREKHQLSAGQIRSVEVSAEHSVDRICNIPSPRTGLEAKFSLRFNTALAILGADTSSPDSYSRKMIDNPDVIALQDRVAIKLMGDGWPRYHTSVKVELLDGRVLAQRWDTSRAESDLSAQGKRLMGKFLSLSCSTLTDARAISLASGINGIEDLDNISELLGMTR